MTDNASVAHPVDRTDPPGEVIARARTAPLATLIGAIAGAVAFSLCTLWLGPMAGIVIALAATLLALARRHARAAIAFAAAGALSTFALRPSTALMLVAALAFGVGLALVSRRSSRPELLA